MSQRDLSCSFLAKPELAKITPFPIRGELENTVRLRGSQATDSITSDRLKGWPGTSQATDGLTSDKSEGIAWNLDELPRQPPK